MNSMQFNLKKYVYLLFYSYCFIGSIHGQSDLIYTPRKSITYNHGIYNGLSIDYSAIVNESMLFADSSNVPAASVITTSYIRENDLSDNRPILFIFNGGPGASSSPLHMNAFGPWRIQHLSDSNILIENNASLLDRADLVFIDPPGTGYTRTFSNKASTFWDVKRDAQLFIDVITEWKHDHHRDSSSVFLCGESYGTLRAAEMLGIAKNFPVAGVIFLSSVFDLSITAPALGNDMPYVLYMPSMAAVSWYHHLLQPKMKSPEQAYLAAMRFAQKEYISALAQGINLTTKEKDHIASILSNLIGLSKELILEKNLRITPKEFQLSLLSKQGKRIGQLNGQITGPLHNPGVKPPFDDPSMTMSPSNREIVGKYFLQTLQFSDSLPYKTLNLDVNSKWNWTSSLSDELGYFTVAPGITKAMNEHPHLKLFVAGGYYDLATPLYAARHILEHINIPKERITYANFPTGHSIFEKESELNNLNHQIRGFIQNQLKNK